MRNNRANLGKKIWKVRVIIPYFALPKPKMHEMGENLVIVESPAKAKTIEKFLGKGYTVKSSFGHIRDLKKNGLGIDLANGFEPQYEVSSDKKKTVAELSAAAGKAETVWERILDFFDRIIAFFKNLFKIG